MSSRDLDHIKDIFNAAVAISRFMKDHSHQEFLNDEVIQSAVTYKILVIGEATNRLSQEFKNQHSQIPWVHIVGARNRLIHRYHDFDIDVLWNMVNRSVPDLLKQIEPLLEME